MSKDSLKNLIKLIVVCVLACVVTIVAVIFLVQDNAYAWFAKNNQVSANGMQVTVKSDYDVELTVKASSELSLLYPGQIATYKLTFKNNESEALKTNVFLTVGEETAIEDNRGNYYYFGSQIQVTTDFDNETKFFLLETEAKNSGQVSYVNTPRTAEDKQVISGLVLPASSTVTVTITFTFVDNGDDQNGYINFGNSSGSCSRGILAVFSQ